MSKDKAIKTNAQRILDFMKITYETHTYIAPEGFLDGVSVAKVIGLIPDTVYKTLVLQGVSKQYYVCIIPVALELDLKLAARHFNEKSLEMIPVKDITNVTGYIKGGCSPVGMKKVYKTAVSKQAAALEQITVSAGKVGLQMTLSPNDLLSASNASFAILTKVD